MVGFYKNRARIFEEIKEISQIFFPLSLAQLMQVSITLCSNLALGGISVEALASGGICNLLIQTGVVIVQSVISSFQSLLGHAKGKGGADGEAAATRFVACACAIALILSVFLVVILFLIVMICRVYLFENAIGKGAVQYMQSAVFAVPGMVFFSVMRAYASATGRSSIILKAVGSGALVFGISSLALLKCFHGSGHSVLTLMGIIFALSWTVAAVLSFIFLDIYKIIKKTHLHDTRSDIKKSSMAILHAGWPVGLCVASEMSANTILAMFIGTAGVAQMSVHQLCQSIELLTFMPSLAMSQAVSVRVSYYHGRQDYERCRFVHRVAIIFIILVAIVEAITILLFHRTIYNAYINDNGQVSTSFGSNLDYMFVVVCCIVVFDALQAASSGALRGKLDMKVPMFMAVASYWIVGFLFAITLAHLVSQPVLGVWIGICIGVFCSACLQTLRFSSVNKVRIV